MARECRSILVVEDDDAIRDGLRDLLQFEGYPVFTGADGKEGLEMLGEIPRPCLILLDLLMPVMTGQEFLQAQRSDDLIAAIPVVVISAYAGDARHLSAAGFVKKPIDLDSLLDFVKRYCGPPARPAEKPDPGTEP